MMKKFKELFVEKAFNRAVEFPSAEVTFNQHTLGIRFDSKDVVIIAGYVGPTDPWLSSLCYLVRDKTLNELLHFSWRNWEEAFRDDQAFWDFRQELGEPFFFYPLEMLKALLDVYGGRDYLYQDSSPLVCRCFGVREADILEHLQKEATPTLETLAGISKAGMGCRSCVPQLKRWFGQKEDGKKHFYKDRPLADWLLDIDYHLSRFPKSSEWGMEVESFKGKQVLVSFNKQVSQREEELTSKELQDFLGSSVDSDLGFFLRRARHFSNAKG